MFFLKRLEHEIILHPKYFGRKMDEILLQRLHAEVESTCTGRYGYIVCVTTVDSVSKGRIIEGTGMATFVVKYRAIVFRPFKGEVVDAIVTQVNQMGFFAEVGPLQVFVSNHVS
jgi:DNA-directed RNA polymerase II subunit RPB7